ncbi:MAG: hypothetical protein ACOYLB_09405 [Phototrophicaceae bacterium]
MSRLLIGLVLILSVGCSALDIPTPPPTRAFTAPTLPPTVPFLPFLATELPSGYQDGIGSNDPTVAALPNNLAIPPLVLANQDGYQVVQLTLSNGTTTQGLLITPSVGRVAGLVVFTSITDENTASQWGHWRDQGVVVLVVNAVTFDTVMFTDVIDSFSDLALGDTAQLDPSRLAVLADANSAESAWVGCAQDLRCDAFVVFQPNPTATTLASGVALRERSVLLVVDQTQPNLVTTANAILANLGDNASVQWVEGNLSSADQLHNNPQLVQVIVQWLQTHLP